MRKPAILVTAALAFTAVAFVANHTKNSGLNLETGERPAAAEIQTLLERHCSTCHATQPTFAGYATAPGGLIFSSPDDLLAQADRVRSSIASSYMPLANLSGITPEERARLINWVTPE